MSKFTTRARTVEMLGRQQVAGIPTAISELFKNAHDAFADTVEVDYFRPEQLFVLRDDGIGMTLNDFENKWLSLGTDSKSSKSDELLKIASSLGVKPRTILGEKGIGRLAIGTIGPQVLILTRARRENSVQKLVAAFVNWSMFALPGINLDDIYIPTRTFGPDKLPKASDVDDMVGEVRSNLQALSSRIDAGLLADIERELDEFKVDPAVLNHRWKKPTLSGSGCGTHFYIQPTDEMLAAAIDETDPITPGKATNIQKMLVGFANTMVPKHEQPVIHAEFRDHPTSDFSESVISDTEFFTPDDFKIADHQIQGKFDEFGQFHGTVKVYGNAPVDHSMSWVGSHGRPTECGPFRIDFAYVQGTQRESQLSPERYIEITKKLTQFGGIYLYRDGIRVLPYGNQDYDFLNIEERRTKSAGYYFFSYRRIFGAIAIDKLANPRLIEKAGREGFLENRAYRQFREILENFFVQLAADFFRRGGTQASTFSETRSNFSRRYQADREREKLVGQQRESLEDRLEEFFGATALKEPEAAVDSLSKELDRSLRAIGKIQDSAVMIERTLKSEDSARKRLADIREKYRIIEPRGVGLSRALLRDLDAHRSEYIRLVNNVFEPTTSKINATISDFIHKAGVKIDQRARFNRGPTQAVNSAKFVSRRLRRQANTALTKTAREVRQALDSSMEDLVRALDGVVDRVESTDISNMTEADLVKLSLDLDSQIYSISEQKNGIFKGIAQQLESIVVSPKDSGELITRLDMAEVAEEELLALREQADADFDLVQLGMAIEIIDHEFQETIKGIRNSLGRLKVWADVNAGLQDIYNNIRLNFDHLDGYLNLFTPLHRRLRRTQVTIQGSEIATFLSELFGERLVRHESKLVSTTRFRSHRFVSYPSTFYPVFVNLVDNAIYWLRDSSQPREIKLDATDDKMIISNTGPIISPRDREAIFELGFTRKPAGRGLGLYICRQVLSRVGYELTLESTGSDSGASFAIKPSQEGGQ